MREKQAYVTQIQGHKDSSGNLAEWVIKDHSTDKILSSHSSEQAAKEHLQQMHIHKDKKSEAAPEVFKWFKSIDALLDRNCTGGM